MPLHRRLPKRGFNKPSRMKLNEVNLGRCSRRSTPASSTPGDVDAAALVKAGVLRRAKDGVRLLGSGELKAKVALRGLGRVEVGGRGGREGRRLGRRSSAPKRKEAEDGGLTPNRQRRASRAI